MSVGKVLVGNLLGAKEHNDFIVHILHPASVESVFESRPSGAYLLWLDEPRAASQRKCPLHVSVKLKRTIMKHVYDRFPFQVHFGHQNQPKCRIASKLYRQIQELNVKFFPVLRLFVAEFSQNRNFIESFDESDLEKELVYRRFVIFPVEQKIYIKRKVGKDIQTASIGIDFENGEFWTEVEDRGLVKQIRSFNAFLFEFLEVDTTSKLKVKAALGYQDGVDLYTGELKDKTTQPKDNSVMADGDETLTIVTDREKKKLFHDLEQAIAAATSKHWASVPPTVTHYLKQIYASTSILQQTFEKMDWIDRGVFDKLVRVMALNANNEKDNEIPIKIVEHLVEDNLHGGQKFCAMAMPILEQNLENVGLFACFVKLVKSEDFVHTFVKHLGYNRFLNVYVNASILLMGDQSKEFGECLDEEHGLGYTPDTPLAAAASSDEDDTNDDDDVAVAISPGRPAIPRIKMPPLNFKTEAVNRHTTRGDRREKSSRGKGPKVKVKDFEQSPMEQLDHIANMLGESYVSTDLPDLLKYKKGKENKEEAMEGLFFGARDSGSGSVALEMKSPEEQMVNTNYYKIKCHVLRTLSVVSSNPRYFRNYRNPVNLFFTELLISHKDGLVTFNNDLRDLIYKALANFSDSVEGVHRMRWRQLTQGMTLFERRSFRAGMDKFLWRVHNRLIPAVENKDHEEWNLQLTLLSEYMRNCPNRVMSAQVMDLCVEPILNILQFVVSFRLSADALDFAQTAHLLWAVLDEIAVLSRSPIIDDFLIALLLDREEVFRYYKVYCTQLWFNKDVIGLMEEKGKSIEEYRIRTIIHAQTLVTLLNRLLRRIEEEGGDQDRFKAVIAQYQKLEFLVTPIDSAHFWQAMTTESIRLTYPLRKHFLSFFCDFFSSPRCPFVQLKSFTDQYIEYHYLLFVKLYKSEYRDPDTLELCRLVILLLFRFAVIRSEDIVRKFYQLGCVNFLVREISLEHGLTMKAEPIELEEEEALREQNREFPLSWKQMMEDDKAMQGSMTSRKTSRRQKSFSLPSNRQTRGVKRSPLKKNKSPPSSSRGKNKSRPSSETKIDKKSTVKVVKSTSSSEEEEEAPKPSQIKITGLALTGDMTRDGTAVKGKDTVVGAKSDSESESEESSSSEEDEPPKKAPIKIAGLALTANMTRDGTAVKGKDTVVGAKSDSESESEESSSSEEDEPPKKAPIKIAGLALTANMTRDGTAVKGKDTVVGAKSDSESESEESSSSEEDEPPKKAPIKIAGLALTANMTRDGTAVKGKDTVVGAKSDSESESESEESSSSEEDEPPKKAPIKIAGLALTANMTRDGTAVKGKDTVVGAKSDSDSESESESEESSSSEDEPPKKAPIKIAGLSLTANMTRDGTAVQGKDTVVGADSDSSDESSDYSDSEGNDDNRPKPAIRIKGLSLTANMTRDGTAVKGKDTVVGRSDSDSSGSEADSEETDSSSSDEEPRKAPIKIKGLALTADMTRDGTAVKGKNVVVGGKKKQGDSDSESDDSSEDDSSEDEGEKKTKRSKKKVHLSEEESDDTSSSDYYSSGEEMPAIITKLKLQGVEKKQEKKPEAEDEREKEEKKERGLKEQEGQLAKLFGNMGDGAKMQVRLEKKHDLEDDSVPDDVLERNHRYLQARRSRKVYSSPELQALAITLIVSLMIRSNGTLEEKYTGQFPLTQGKLNIPFILHKHINHPANMDVVEPLVKMVQDAGDAEYRLLKLLCARLFDPSKFKGLSRLAVGAFGVVYQAYLPQLQERVAVKMMDVPKNIFDRCVLHDIFTEITILDRFRGDNRVCQMLDYGVDGDHYWISMKFYKGSLKQWRMKQSAPLKQNLPIYLNIFLNIVNAMKWLEENKVNHYDIKCDNYLIEPLVENCAEEDLWFQQSDVPNFSLCIADFGESKIYETELEGYTIRNRGTEYNKSPEMLNVAYASQKTRATYDRRKKIGANIANDMWSLGCAFYELLTGEFLFYDNDWIHFFFRVTDKNQQLLTDQRKALIDNNPTLIEFFEFIFQRNPDFRPTISEILTKFKQTVARLAEEGYLKPKPSNTPSEQVKAPPKPKMALEETSKQKIHMTDRGFKIREHFYFGSRECALRRDYLKRELDITHIVCTTSERSDFPWDFAYHHCVLAEDKKMLALIEQKSLFQSIEEARQAGGRILVTHHVSVVMWYLMRSENLSYSEAFLQVERACPHFSLETKFFQELHEWDRRKAGELSKDALYFQCICGSCCYTLLSPFSAKFISCKCVEGSENCPTDGCSEFLQFYKKTYGFGFDSLSWCYSSNQNIVFPDLALYTVKVGDSRAAAAPAMPSPAMALARRGQADIPSISLTSSTLTSPHPNGVTVMTSSILCGTSKEWEVYRCGGCDYVVFAIRVGTSDVACVANLNVSGRKVSLN